MSRAAFCFSNWHLLVSQKKKKNSLNAKISFWFKVSFNRKSFISRGKLCSLLILMDFKVFKETGLHNTLFDLI